MTWRWFDFSLRCDMIWITCLYKNDVSKGVHSDSNWFKVEVERSPTAISNIKRSPLTAANCIPRSFWRALIRSWWKNCSRPSSDNLTCLLRGWRCCKKLPHQISNRVFGQASDTLRGLRLSFISYGFSPTFWLKNLRLFLISSLQIYVC